LKQLPGGGRRFTAVITFLLIAGFWSGLADARQTHDAQVTEPPAPKYPMIASWLNLEGHCEVRFAVDEAGLAFAVQPRCSRPIFCFEAKRAVMAVKFEPKRVDGVPRVRTNVYFPLIWAFEGSDYNSETDPRLLEPCQELPVS